MARPRTFDENRAVEAAMRAFWTSGYEGTSTQDLCAATGLGRSSIYNTFAGKHELFDKALDRYIELRTGEILELLAGPEPVRDKVRTLFWRAVDAEAGDPPGCLVVNSIVELAPSDPAVAARLDRDFEVRLAALRTAFDAARRAGEIDRGKDPLALAHFVISTIGGMRVAARGGADRTVLEGIATTALGAL